MAYLTGPSCHGCRVDGCGWCVDIHTKEAAAANYQGGSYQPGMFDTMAS
jgi:hypothetical protein